MVLDGEIVAFDTNGKPSFNALQNRVQLKSAREIAGADQATPAVYFCFDLLHFAGIDLRDTPYRDRRRYLSQCLLPSPLVQLVHAPRMPMRCRKQRSRAVSRASWVRKKTASTSPGAARRSGSR
jgi:ATP-dependent DNA ligase